MGTTTTERTEVIPAPRAPADDTIPAEEPEHTLPEPHYPWPEPWRSYRGARPRSEYWDVATASWHSRGPVNR